ncbi:hypothetical protein HYX16_04535 [Candidatus Woesearchaeota archaeon]|nr:hypothetical protein [Candidatus Woesearchaeota archaeon]
MNKKGNTLTLETIAGIALAVLIILGLSIGISNIYNAILGSKPELKENFNEFKENISYVTKTGNPKEMKLVIPREKYIFGIGKNQEFINAKLSSAPTEPTPISKPKECSGYSCICSCFLKKVQKTQTAPFHLECDKQRSCFPLPSEIENVYEENSNVYIIDKEDAIFKEVHNPEKVFLIISFITNSKKIGLNIKKQNKDLVFSFSP